MIQIIRQRQFAGHNKPVFVFTEPKLFTENLSSVFKASGELLEKLAPEERYNIFYTVAHHAGAMEASRAESHITKPQRTAATFEYQTVLPFDIDGADTSRAFEYADELGKVMGVPRDAMTVVKSGNGIHCLINLKTPIRSAKYFDDHRDAYREICDKATKAMLAAGLPLSDAGKKVDSSIFEPARVLRLPGSVNKKPGKPDTICALLQFSQVILEIDLDKISGIAQRAAENVSPVDIRRQYPSPDFKRLVDPEHGCAFIKWAIENPGEIHEPHAFDLFSLLGPQNQAATATVGALELTPKQTAELIFKSASNSASLAKSDFTEKWDQALEYGARKCSTINAHWGKCQTCPHFGKIQTPLALKSKDHIASEVNGYWVLSSNGVPQYPAYEDLAKVFAREMPFICIGTRIFAYADGYWKEVHDQGVKSWLETKLTPTEPLRESMAVEFVSKAKRVGFISPERETELFETNTSGKLNCANGVLNILTGEMMPHSDSYGFKYKLPYAVDLNAEGSEVFLDWLDKITEGDIDLFKSILDLMAYCLWPNYDDHVFAYFIGEGKNGKSTLIHVIEKILGAENVSNIGLQPLCNTRFASASLEGKLANLSEESSGGNAELSSEALNIIKTLSSGGTLYAERKGEQGFDFRNKAKLIFSANLAPRFRETSTAITRRMLVIPFKHKIQDPDSRVEERLIAEVPAIVSMLIRRIQTNVKLNGRFLVHRGGKTAEDAQKEMLHATNTTYVWAKETLEISLALGETSVIAVDEAYAQYRDWCEDNGHKNPASKVKFARDLGDNVMPRPSVVKRVSGKVCRVYPYARYRKEAHDEAQAHPAV